MWIRQGDSGTLFARMPEIQRTKKKATRGGRHGQDENRDLARRPNKDKAYDGVYQRNRKIVKG
jgi:hypothetical protein